MAKVTDFPSIPAGTRRSSEIRKAFGEVPPERQALGLVPFTFYDGTRIPGGVHPLFFTTMEHMDAVFRRHRYQLDRYADGDDWCYNRRSTRNGGVWSLHSWAIAVDINSTENHYSRRFATTFTPQIIADIQTIRHPNGRPALQWGGTWGLHGSRFDTMHFQTSLTPAELRTMPGPNQPAPAPPVAPGPDPAEVATTTVQLQEPDPAVMEELRRLGDAVGQLQNENTTLAGHVQVLGDIVSGAPFYELASWIVAGVMGRPGTNQEVQAAAAKLVNGESAESVHRLITERKNS